MRNFRVAQIYLHFFLWCEMSVNSSVVLGHPTMMPNGILSSTCKKETIPRIKDQLPEQSLIRAEYPKPEAYNPKICPHCRTETMVSLEILPKRGPPAHARLMETARLLKK
jgi:hypothetical protein